MYAASRVGVSADTFPLGNTEFEMSNSADLVALRRCQDRHRFDNVLGFGGR